MLFGLLFYLSLNNLKVLKIHKTKAVKNICIQENFIFRLTFIIWVSVNRPPNNPALLTTS